MSKRSLADRLALGFAAMALASALVTSLLSGLLVARQFNQYLLDYRKEREVALVQELETLMSANRLDERALLNISSAAMADHVHIRIFDASGHLLWEEGPWRLHEVMIGEELIGGHISEETYELKSPAGVFLGTVVFGYVTAFPSPAQIAYARSIRLAGLIGAVLAAGFAIPLGWMAAERIAKPIRRLTAAIRNQRSGQSYSPYQRQDEVSELTDAFQQFRETLLKQERQRKQLTADVAHELRTPLAALRAQVEAMQDGVYEVSPDRLARCHKEVLRLTSLVDDVESLATLEAENYNMEKELKDLAHIAEHVAESFRPAYEQAGLKLTVDTAKAPVWLDESRISQVIINLMSNALKYAPSGCEVLVRVWCSSKEAVLEVQNGGKGIPEEDLPYLFDRFYRGDKSRDRKSGGAGLGLAIAKAIVEAHGGSISVQNVDQGGVRFTVRLPKKAS